MTLSLVLGVCLLAFSLRRPAASAAGVALAAECRSEIVPVSPALLKDEEFKGSRVASRLAAAPPVFDVETDLPAAYNIATPRHEYQRLNNCGPVTAMMTLDLYGISVTQAEAASYLKPGAGDRNVTMDEMAHYLNNYGLNAPIRVGGDLELVQRLVSHNVPVILHQQMTLSDDIGHYRVATGYDEARGIVVTHDSYLGPEHLIPFETFMTLWAPYHFEYIPVFWFDREDEVRELLGSAWDEGENWAEALEQAQRDTTETPNDAFAWWRLGQARHHTGDYAAAYNAFQEAVALGLPDKHFWYQFTPFETLLEVEDYDELLRFSNRVLAGYPTNPEVLVYKGRALAGLGQSREATRLFQRALAEDPQNALARAALAN